MDCPHCGVAADQVGLRWVCSGCSATWPAAPVGSHQAVGPGDRVRVGEGATARLARVVRADPRRVQVVFEAGDPLGAQEQIVPREQITVLADPRAAKCRRALDGG